ncbi:MAG TPA: poly-beta-1,6 N-acetyl-D-glucosamine synthase [Acinetobacter ursingii]|uniref:Poly-beta-1,6-N-acetyl-D-glucosamine synthase n=3 Tax=Acinetobacter TaxID=469 RepID=N9DG27_9GAMM|nr:MULTISPECIES: poly-beta-1,6-N-acetyl-D-glucosamine synthase [Acinetobacter]NOZ96570.1 poly-beta-1,6 N-acetyl-D-glucosamine synthase [Gammaproteobacteria bacterium]ENV75963.1 poly-beta-1,6 N-acetyl-D-glucosamine synthase [Acinetobacter ursingii DSM 16037 = CIP 107286]ENV79735.1 poly-beta-1,6 N-acetyl-D-glucosamine synthase [Acinetobacter ursingii ANC 3649]ENX49334.1 poly-beta-1,6 N-acetyl-D-glucosamine synthase [Acinetobacter ursingii NIPH 706]EXD30757.1 poly-beta-1,6 N-acetyl-D-glucosamine 
MSTTLQHLWHSALNFVFYYPLFMSYLWMMGALIFYWKERKEPPYQQPAELDVYPMVAVLIPCFNEGDNAEETISHALSLDYPNFEVIAINDGSSDNTAEVLDRLAERFEKLRVVHLAQNQGKAVALQAGSLLTQAEFLIGIDGDALLDPHAAKWMIRHFLQDRTVAAVTGNPRIRTRSTLLGRIQVGEFSSIVGMIKRAQRSFGRLFTVSGVITAFRKSAVHEVGYWSPNMLTEDIDITWKLQRAGWDIRFEPNALVWILMPETLNGLWKQRLRWAMGGAQVLVKNLDVFFKPKLNFLWPLMFELCLTLVWSYLMLIMAILWLLHFVVPLGELSGISSPFLPYGSGILLGATCLLQFALSKWMDSRYEPNLGKNYYWMIWYPFVFWLITITATIVAFPKVLLRGDEKRARWVSPDRGMRM